MKQWYLVMPSMSQLEFLLNVRKESQLDNISNTEAPKVEKRGMFQSEGGAETGIQRR